MANSRGKDAAEIKPKFVPDYELQGRDDSGGPDYAPYTAEFGDGGFVQGGAKAHLSATGGSEKAENGDELDQEPRSGDRGDYKRKSKSEVDAPSSSKAMSRK